MLVITPWPVLLAVALHGFLFFLQRDVGLNLQDEGFVWYGAQRVVAGEFPLRDFQAYDIGRYYWYAAWMQLMQSTGIVPVRAASAVLAACAVVLALATLVRGAAGQGKTVVLLALVTFAVWMVPYYKVADSFATLLLLAGLARLLHRFSIRRCFDYGICLGVAATIGINHGLYGTLSIVLALIWAHTTRQQAFALRWPGAVAAGVAVGYLPMLVFLATVPGFAAAFFDGILLLFEIGMTNLELPLPSPAALWENHQTRLTVALHESVMGLSIWAALVFLVVCAVRLVRNPGAFVGPPNAVFVAAVLTSLPYAHYVWSRPNIMHFAVSALPPLVAMWSYPTDSPGGTGRLRVLALAMVMLMSGLLAGPQHAVFQLLRGTPLHPVVVGDEPLRVRAQEAAELRLLQRATESHAPGGRPIYVVPYWPGAYAAMSRRAPTWEIYQIFPASLHRQQREIARLIAADVGFASVLQHSADSRPDLGFAQTHSAIAAYLQHCFSRVPDADAARLDVLLFVSRNSPCAMP